MANKILIGAEKFDELILSDSLYIDKTKQIKDLFASNEDHSISIAKIMLFTRPRRFGKTLTINMLKNFFELNYVDPNDNSRAQKLFSNLAIAKEQNFCKQHLGKHPVIAISLKGIDGSKFQDALEVMLTRIFNLYKDYTFLLQDPYLSKEEKDAFYYTYDFCNSKSRDWKDSNYVTAAVSVIKNSLFNLTAFLYSAYKLNTIVLVDEYDVPLQKATLGNYYTAMLDVVRGMFEGVFKSNDYLEKGIVTGCLRISHESIFTGINNFSIYSVNDPRYNDFIGFTKKEVYDLLQDQNLSNRKDEVISWYDGYNFGGKEMLCPWSVLNFCALAKASHNKIAPQNFWTNSSGNDIIEICLKRKNEIDSQKIQNLLDGQNITLKNCEFTSYPKIDNSCAFDIMLTMMLHTGYLTVANFDKYSSILVKIPNREILDCFRLKIENIFSENDAPWFEQGLKLKQALFEGKTELAQDLINTMLINFVSIRDSAKESFYHAFLSGVLSMSINSTEILKSDQESGLGYADLKMYSPSRRKAVIMEFKKLDHDDAFEDVCLQALAQIESKGYAHEFEQKHYHIQKYGIGFIGKSCMILKA